MENFNIYPDNIIRYSDYYQIAWVYIHRLVKCKNVIIESNLNDLEGDDLQTITRNHRNIKIVLKTNELSESNSVIYDNEW